MRLQQDIHSVVETLFSVYKKAVLNEDKLPQDNEALSIDRTTLDEACHTYFETDNSTAQAIKNYESIIKKFALPLSVNAMNRILIL